MRPVSFTWKSNPEWGNKIGFVAQELQPVIKEVVHTDSTDKQAMLGVNYGEIVPVVVKAIQEQQEMIAHQQKENQELRKKNEELEKDIKLIKEKLGLTVNN